MSTTTRPRRCSAASGTRDAGTVVAASFPCVVTIKDVNNWQTTVGATGRLESGQVRITVQTDQVYIGPRSWREWTSWFLLAVLFAGGLTAARIAIYVAELCIPRFFWFLAQVMTAVFQPQ